MTEWLPMRCDLDEDPAVIRLSLLTGLPVDHVVGKLWKFWRWCHRQMVDGSAEGLTPEWLDTYLSHPGFAGHLIAVGWLRFTSKGLTVPNFDRYFGGAAKKRLLTNLRVAKNRAKNPAVFAQQPSSCNGIVTPAALPDEESCNETSVTEALRERYESVTRGDKIREEKKNPPLAPPSGGMDAASQKKSAADDWPAALDNPLFRSAWAEWLAYRRERRLPVYKPIGRKRLFSRLAEIGSERAAAAIEYSIAQNWTGIFEERAAPTKPRGGVPVTSAESETQRIERIRRERQAEADARAKCLPPEEARAKLNRLLPLIGAAVNGKKPNGHAAERAEWPLDGIGDDG